MAGPGRALTLLPPVATARLLVEPLRGGDAEALREITDHAAIIEAVSFLEAPFTLADAARLIGRNRAGGDCFFGVREAGTGRLVGVVGAHLAGETGIEVGYWFGAGSQGRGYATEALRALTAALRRRFRARSIVAECRPANRASWRVLEKAGFEPTGEPGERAGRQRLVQRPAG